MLIRNVRLPDLGVDYTGISLKANRTVYTCDLCTLCTYVLTQQKSSLRRKITSLFWGQGALF